MAIVAQCLPLLLLASASVGQYDGYEAYEQLLDSYREPLGHRAPTAHHHAPPISHHHSEEHHGEEYDVDFHAHPKYAFDYSVKDPHTGDDKEHWETRDGDKVKGSYTVIETDGTKRVVEYEADDKNGFNAVVHKIGTPKEEVRVTKPVFEVNHGYEPLRFHNEPQPHHGFEDGFVPVVGGYGHFNRE